MGSALCATLRTRRAPRISPSRRGGAPRPYDVAAARSWVPEPAPGELAPRGGVLGPPVHGPGRAARGAGPAARDARRGVRPRRRPGARDLEALRRQRGLAPDRPGQPGDESAQPEHERKDQVVRARERDERPRVRGASTSAALADRRRGEEYETKQSDEQPDRHERRRPADQLAQPAEEDPHAASPFRDLGSPMPCMRPSADASPPVSSRNSSSSAITSVIRTTPALLAE